MVIEEMKYVEWNIVLDPRCKEGKLYLDRRGPELKNREKENGRNSPLIVDNPFPLYLMNTFEVNQDFMNGEHCTFYSFLEKILGEESVAGNILMDEYSKIGGYNGYISLYEFAEILDRIGDRLSKEGKSKDSKEMQVLYYAKSMLDNHLFGSKTIMENCPELIPGFIEKSFGFYDKRLYDSLYMYMWLDEYEWWYQVSVKEFLERFKSWMKKFNGFISWIVKEHQIDKWS